MFLRPTLRFNRFVVRYYSGHKPMICLKLSKANGATVPDKPMICLKLSKANGATVPDVVGTTLNSPYKDLIGTWCRLQNHRQAKLSLEVEIVNHYLLLE
jgi:hypothetical protein